MKSNKMKLNRNIVIPCIVSCSLITFYCLYVYSSGTGRSSFIGSSSYCRQLSALHNNAIVNLKEILSVMERNPTQYKKEITSKLSETIRMLSSELTDKSVIKDLTDLSAANSDSIPEPNNSSEEPSSDKPSSLVANTRPYACPEEFRHAKYGAPHFMKDSWVTKDCGYVEHISKILTVVFVTSKDNSCSAAENKLLEQIVKEYHNLSIIIGAPENSKCLSYIPVHAISIVTYSNNTNLGGNLNVLIDAVKTPLTLITRRMDAFNWLARLERQLSVFSAEPSAVIVGGSIRNKTGHWQVGCYQTQLKRYILEYIEGYYESRHECMYCEHLIGPFIAKSSVLRAHKFDENVEDDVVFEDFFLTVKQSNAGSILACPDVMYHSTDPGIQLKINERKTWFSLSAKWALNRIVLPDGITHKFSCEESKLNCKSLSRQVDAMMMPVCCRDALINGYKVFHKFCVKNKVVYQIVGGSMLGAVKLNDVIPWDFDGDGNYYKDQKKLFSKEMNWTNSEGEVYVDHINFKADGFFKVSTPDAFIEFSAKPMLSADISKSTKIYRKKPTLIRIGDAWVYAPPSPGLFVRNYYGNEILRHSNSYYHLGRKHSNSPYNVSDPFLRCKVKHGIKHHSCLDQFSKDGNIQFKIPDAKNRII